MVVVQGPRRKRLRVDENVSVVVVAPANASESLAPGMIERCLPPLTGQAKNVSDESLPNRLAVCRGRVGGVPVTDGDNLEDGAVIVNLCEVSHKVSLNRVPNDDDTFAAVTASRSRAAA
jgi:hypothetical protein